MIGLLDIAGFENFEVNSFEQLCINVSNEQLQHYFNQHIFAWEKKDLENEGVKTSHISFTNNSAILSMFIDVSVWEFSVFSLGRHLQQLDDYSLWLTLYNCITYFVIF